MLKPISVSAYRVRQGQPPSGGCVLKHRCFFCFSRFFDQPPSGGCVLKLLRFIFQKLGYSQPPSGGCVLKPVINTAKTQAIEPAAFGRLCVETSFLILTI